MLAGVGITALWFTLSLFLSATHAHAAERPAGLLGDLTEVISDTTKAVDKTVSTVVAPVTAVVPVDQVLPAAVNDTVNVVTQTVTPVADAVTHVPVVGPSVGSVVTDTLDGVTGVVNNTVTPVLENLTSTPVGTVTDPVVELLDELPKVITPDAGSGSDTPLEPILGVIEPLDSLASADSASERSVLASTTKSSVLTSVGTAGYVLYAAVSNSPSALVLSDAPLSSDSAPGTPPASPPGSPASSSSSAGSGSGTSGAFACLAGDNSPILDARGGTVGAQSTRVPAPPLFDTDISPD